MSQTLRLGMICWHACILLGASIQSTRACNVPVFRYALERWAAGEYTCEVLHRGGLSPSEQQQLRSLTNSAVELGANVLFKTIDIAQPENAAKVLPPLNGTNAAQGPWIVLRSPDFTEEESAVWSGSLADAFKSLLNSPARRELGQRLIRGDSVVWLLVESGDKEADERVATLLTNELKQLEAAIKLPPPAADDPAPRSALPLRIGFTVQRLERNAADEGIFLRMLLHDEETDATKPVVVPVFGRGRSLKALSGTELSAKIFRQAAVFLCGACSCEVKELNPGKDLLMAVKWENILNAPVAEEPKLSPGQRVEIPPGNAALAQASETPKAQPAPKAHVPNQKRGMKLLVSTSLAIGSIMLLLVAIALVHSLRKP